MKKMTICLTVFALCVLVLNGCSNMFLEKSAVAPEQTPITQDIPEGYGTIRVRFSRGEARTIMPEADMANLYLEYWFAKDGGTAEKKTPAGSIFTLEPGSYALEVKAFVDGAHNDLAARGETTFTITAGVDAGTAELTMCPVVSGTGTGSLTFSLKYPSGATVEAFTLSRIAGEETYGLTGTISGTGTVELSGTKNNMPVGYYLLRVELKTSGGSTGRTEVVHIYQNLSAEVDYTFIGDDFRAFRVTSAADAGPGSLRQALTDVNAFTGSARAIRVVLEPGSVIELESALPYISKSVTIEGSGVTLTRAASWTSSDDYSQLLFISGSTADVTIRQVHFKNGLVTGNGGAINNRGNLTLESCVFSGNQATTGSSNSYGGAICSYGNTLTIRGCTFYGNTSDYAGGVVYFNAEGKILTLTGNLFYGNTASYYPVVWASSGTVNASYNVVDMALGTGITNRSGWAAGTGDESIGTDISARPISPLTFKLVSGSGAAGKLPGSLPEGYPVADFYGQPISGGGAAGAVQELASGYRLDSRVVGQGLITVISGAANSDGFYDSGTSVRLHTVPGEGRVFGYWKVDGVAQPKQTPADEITVTINADMVVEAVCTLIPVTSGADSGPGTLRQALADSLDGDTIILDLTGDKTITLTSELSISKSINLIIEGNGATLTGTNRLLYIGSNGADVTIRRLRFKDGLATDYGGAIENFGTLTLESCIFSGNRATTGSSNSYGGAIHSYGNTLTIRGCTFYGNTSDYAGGVVYFNAEGKILTLTGNLFYGNTASYYPVVWVSNGTVSASYNVSDKATGTGVSRSGWEFAATDVQAAVIPIGPVSLKPRPGLAAAGRITTRPGDYPTVDFYGDPIPAADAHAGAVQELSGGYSLDWQVTGLGSISVISGTADADGFYASGTNVILRAVPVGQRVVGYWKVNGVVQTPANEITLTMDTNKTVEVHIVGLYVAPVTKVDFGGNNTATVAFPGLANRNVFLVKVNKGDTNVAAADSGGVDGAESLPLTSIAPSFASSSNAAGSGSEPPLMDHPLAMEFNANPPPITAAMRQEPRNIARSGLAAAPLPSPVVGDTRMFWVETTYSSREFIQKQATLRATGTYGNVWVMDDVYSAFDDGGTSSDLKITTAQAEAMAQKFDLIYPAETKLIGYEYGGDPNDQETYGGKDGDPKVQILVYDFMGGTGGSCGAAGFFWSKDFYTDAQLGSSYKSNLAEIFYLSVDTVDSSSDYKYGTLAHEFQHMINFNQKYVLHSKSSPSWYDEMLADMAKDVISPLIGVGRTIQAM